MMANPSVLLGLAIAWALSCAYSYHSGAVNKENEVKAEYSRQLDAKIQEHNNDAAIDMQAAFEWGAKRAAATRQSNVQAGKVDADILAHPLDCRLSEPSVRLLNASVAAANDNAVAPVSVPEPMPGTTGTDSGGRGNPAAVGESRTRAGR